MKSPTTFPEILQQESGWLYPIRHLGRISGIVNGGLNHASLILSATTATDASLSERHRAKAIRMLENGVDLKVFTPTPWPCPPSASSPLRVLFVGRLIPFKGVGMLIDAIAELVKTMPVELSVIGDGPERQRLEEQARSLGISNAVRFLGNQPLHEVSAAMRAAHVFCLPSVRESGGAVLLEAMASSRPVIAVKFGGPGEIVTEEVGRAIEPVGRSHVTQELVATLRSVAIEPDIWRRKGEAGRRRAECEFSWDAKAAEAIALYNQVLSARSTGAAQIYTKTLATSAARQDTGELKPERNLGHGQEKTERLGHHA